jgi:hypothetical protein
VPLRELPWNAVTQCVCRAEFPADFLKTRSECHYHSVDQLVTVMVDSFFYEFRLPFAGRRFLIAHAAHVSNDSISRKQSERTLAESSHP